MRTSATQNTVSSQTTRPLPLPGFEKIKAIWDTQHQLFSARILPGEYYVSRGNEIISTVLGSCISACIRDTSIGIGGMNHFMLPEGSTSDPHHNDVTNTSTRYGSYAMEHMINDILAHGGNRNRLEIKLFGGGQILQSMTNIGQKNIQFVRDYLLMESLTITCEDMGGLHPRKIMYFPSTGRVLVKKLPISDNEKISQRELDYQHTIEDKPVAGEIDLF